jgi:hypothetical protein
MMDNLVKPNQYLDNGAIHSGVPGKGAGDPLGVDILILNLSFL